MKLHLSSSITSALWSVACISIAGPCIAQLASQPDGLIPREVLFGNPDRAGVQISPSGNQLSYLAAKNGVLNVWVQTVGEDDARAVTNATGRPIRNSLWAQNAEQILYVQDKGGDEDFHIYAIDLATGEERDLTPFPKVQARVLSTNRDFPDEILASVNNRDPRLHDVFRINTRTGATEMVYENTEGWIGLVPDSNYRIRLATRMLPDGGTATFIRDGAGDDWSPLAKWDQQDAMTSSTMGFSRDGKTLYMIDSTGVDTGSLYALDAQSDDYARTLVASSKRADISGAIIDPLTGHPQAVSTEFTRREWQVLDDSIRDDLAYLNQLEHGEMAITSRDHADDTWTVAYVKDNGPVKYYLYDRTAKKASYLFSNREALEGLTLASMTPVVIESRDGLNLVSYLTLPANVEPKRLPMVLLVHGGPWARDRWGYNPLHQWLANRGYAVLSVNYRGSTGFGKNFINASTREWAGKMHDDLIDAVDWAVAEGVADPNRVAIMGGSYGGYATLVGLTFTPDVFAAGVDIVGPSHIGTLLDSIPAYWEPIKAMFETRVGSASEPEYLDSISPLTKVDNITRPLLIGQGANDPRVKQAEAEQIVAAMERKSIPVTYVLFPDEGHGFARPVNNMAFFAITETFLAEHLGGRYEPIDDAVAKSSAQVKAGAGLIHGLGDGG